MDPIEQKYLDEIERRGPRWAMARCEDLLYSMRKMLAFHIRQEMPGLTEREVDIQVMRRLYMSDPEAQRLLDRFQERHDRERAQQWRNEGKG